MLIWETVIWDMLTRASTPTSRATAAMVTVASRPPPRRQRPASPPPDRPRGGPWREPEARDRGAARSRFARPRRVDRLPRLRGSIRYRPCDFRLFRRTLSRLNSVDVSYRVAVSDASSLRPSASVQLSAIELPP